MTRLWLFARRGAVGIVVVIAGVLIGLLGVTVMDTRHERDRLFDALQRTTVEAQVDARAAARRIDVLTAQVADLSGQVQTLREQIVSLGGVPAVPVAGVQPGQGPPPQAPPSTQPPRPDPRPRPDPPAPPRPDPQPPRPDPGPPDPGPGPPDPQPPDDGPLCDVVSLPLLCD